MEFVKQIPPSFQSWQSKGHATEEDIVEEQLELNSDVFSIEEQVGVRVCSWNVDQKKPDTLLEKLQAWLHDKARDAPGVIAVGLQEVDMSANAMLREETDPAKPWIRFLAMAAGEGYQQIAARQLAGLLLCVFVRKDLTEHVTHNTVTIVRCGAMGNSVANKGAVIVRFNLYHTSFVFSTAHLAAHQGETEKRNRDFQRIVEYIPTPPCGGATFSSPHERVFFFGDLNYRIDGLSYEATCEYIEKDQIAALHPYDQIEQEDQVQLYQRDYNFTVPQPPFPPTYKFDPGTWRYDTSEKRRVPAWTDRILYRAGDGGPDDAISLVEYTSNRDLLVSDHRPIVGHFDVKVMHEHAEKKARVRSAIMDKITTLGSEYAVPKIVLSENIIDFGNVVYGRQYSRDVQISNRGHAVFMVEIWMFPSTRRSGYATPPSPQHNLTPSWLSLSTIAIRVAPGETKTVTIKCCMDKSAVASFAPGLVRGPFECPSDGSNTGVVDLTQLLVISARQERWSFTCQAKYTPSCFASRLPDLSVLGLVPIATAYNMRKDEQPQLPSRPQVPKELWIMVDYLFRHCRTKNLFQTDIKPKSFEEIRSHLDSKCEPFPAHVDPCATSQALLIFLHDLQEPIMPYKYYARCLGLDGHQRTYPSSLPHLPDANFNCLVYIVSFLRFLLRPENQQHNELTPQLLAQGFSHVLLQPPPNHSTAQHDSERIKRRDYLLHLLQTDSF
eukprot:TRINITY_DN22112_c0_g1_i1.p1 TRINITY_DN22112_c0_g1~~TRINITY_DN22112_c0_g1_i1.p1  ORF type:complete len:723 (+),score=248.79 TRINITY_DN22112_c0_g1_i1:33-2201(+)